MLTIPQWLHDVFGAKQRVLDLVLITAVGLCTPAALAVTFPEVFLAVPLWRSILATLLILDIAAGCLANLTSGTNDFYVSRPQNRWLFIAVHFHLPAVTLLLGLDLFGSVVVWAYTVVGATLVNLVQPGATQRMVAGTLFAVGASGTVIALGSEPMTACLALLFMLKVLVNFAVDHRADGR